MEVFLVLNDHEIDASVDEQERLMLKVAAELGAIPYLIRLREPTSIGEYD
jgi:prophage maintenance system killer protein